MCVYTHTHTYKHTHTHTHIYTGLAKKFVLIFQFIEKSEWTFWPTQYKTHGWEGYTLNASEVDSWEEDKRTMLGKGTSTISERLYPFKNAEVNMTNCMHYLFPGAGSYMFPLLVSGTFSGLLGVSLPPLFLRLWPRVLVSARPLFFPPPEANQPRARCLAPSIASSPRGAPQGRCGVWFPQGCRNGQSTSPGSTSRVWTETNGRNKREGTNGFHPSCLRHFLYLFTYPEVL